MSSTEGGEFHTFIPTKEETEQGRELMNKLFKDLEFYDSPEDRFKNRHKPSKDNKR